MKSFKIGILGSGNMAFCLGQALKNSGYAIAEVYSRNQIEGKKLAKLVSAEFLASPQKLNASDLYLFCLHDDFIESISQKINPENKIFVHTSGSVPLNVFSKSVKQSGVLYPVYSINKNIKPDWKNIPLCIEGSDAATTKLLTHIAKKISNKVYNLDSVKRKQLHLAAVFANNFSNACFSMSEDILKESKIPFDLLRPLILNTAEKVRKNSPRSVQTGPAVRNDSKVLSEHKKLLKSTPELLNIYELLTKYLREK